MIFREFLNGIAFQFLCFSMARANKGALIGSMAAIYVIVMTYSKTCDTVRTMGRHSFRAVCRPTSYMKWM